MPRADKTVPVVIMVAVGGREVMRTQSSLPAHSEEALKTLPHVVLEGMVKSAVLKVISAARLSDPVAVRREMAAVWRSNDELRQAEEARKAAKEGSDG